MNEAFEQMAENFDNKASSSPYADPEDSQIVAEAKEQTYDPAYYKFTEKDIILYNLSLGATEEELPFVFENDEEFAPLPTFGVIPQFETSFSISMDWLPDYNPVRIISPLRDDCECDWSLIFIFPSRPSSCTESSSFRLKLRCLWLVNSSLREGTHFSRSCIVSLPTCVNVAWPLRTGLWKFWTRARLQR